MNRSRLTIALLVAAPLYAQSAGSHLVWRGAQAELVGRSKTVMELQKTKNADGLKQMLDADFKEVASDGHLYEADNMLGDTSGGAVQDYRIYDISIVKVDDQSSIVTYSLILTATEGEGDLAPRYQRVSDLWAKSGTQWKLKFRQETPVRH